MPSSKDKHCYPQKCRVNALKALHIICNFKLNSVRSQLSILGKINKITMPPNLHLREFEKGKSFPFSRTFNRQRDLRSHWNASEHNQKVPIQVEASFKKSTLFNAQKLTAIQLRRLIKMHLPESTVVWSFKKTPLCPFLFEESSRFCQPCHSFAGATWFRALKWLRSTVMT